MHRFHREKVIEKIIIRNGLDSFLITGNADIFYLTGIELEGFWLLLSKYELIALSSKMLSGQLRYLLNDVKVVNGSDCISALKNVLNKSKLKSVGLDSTAVNLELFNRLRKDIKDVEFKEFPEEIKKIREIKEKDEMDKIRKSCAITVDVYNRLIKEIRPGLTEREVSNRAKIYFTEKGVECSFPPLIASGENTAFPHHVSGSRRINEDDIIMIDIGCRYEGYCSDMTRMFGPLNRDRRILNIYNMVKNAKNLSMKRIHPGVEIREIDMISRRYFARYKYDRYFIHSTGHGVGLEIHELPKITNISKDKIKSGMVFTVEPGLYIPGVGGIRIEDTIFVTDTGYEVLTDDRHI